MNSNEAPRVPRAVALIPAAGSGSRLGGSRNKVLLPLDGLPLIVHTVRAFQRHARIAQIAVVLRDGERADFERCLPAGASRAKLLPWIAGGAERQDSVYNGLAALAEQGEGAPDWVLVHDGARPFCSAALLDRVLDALQAAPGVVPVLPVSDTVRRIEADRSEVLPREHLFGTQTPQGFHWDALWNAHRAARERKVRGSDDAQLLEAAGVRVAFVAGEPANLKITTAEDLRYGAWLLRQERERSSGC